MTLEEAIRKLRKEAEDWRKMSRLYPDNCDEFIRRASDNDRIAEWLEELKTLRVELEKNSKELAICKKGLEMACNGDAVVKVWELINGKKAREAN